uniref:CSON013177 protein n=1 Tax=Culicoides sonorensis TaxID=179676 RepID=A0A336KR36_CULSO
MSRKRVKHWGEFEASQDHEMKVVKISTSKIAQLQEVMEKESNGDSQDTNRVYKKLLIKNALVSQALEVNQQTEMISSLLDTYSNNKFNFQPMPNIDFPPSNSAIIDKDRVFQKPIWFIRPIESNFTKGIPKDYDNRITKATVIPAIKKSVCGLLKMAGFAEANSSALVTYVDAVDQFYKYFMEQVRIAVNEQSTHGDTCTEIDIMALEKAYFTMTSKSLTQLHNHFKSDIYVRNRQEIAQYKESMNEYNKLLQENNLKDYMSFLDPTGGQSDRDLPMNFLDQDSREGLKDIMDGP